MFLPLGDDVEKRSLPLAGTYLLLTNVLVFVYQLRLSMDDHTGKLFKEFAEHWGMVPAEVMQGHLVGLVTYMFLHGDVVHLLGNMLVLWAFARTLEDAMGSLYFFCYYLLWGVAAGLLQAVLSMDDPFVAKLPTIGASGAISGVLGAYFIAFGAHTKIRTLVLFVVPMKVEVPAVAFFGFWLLTQAKGIADARQLGETGVAWYAHIGGAAAGVITMALVGRHMKGKLARNEAGELIVHDGTDGTETKKPPSLRQWLDGYGPAAEHAEQVTSDAGAEPSASCPHCGMELGDNDFVGHRLVKCPDCHRLTYLG